MRHFLTFFSCSFILLNALWILDGLFFGFTAWVVFLEGHKRQCCQEQVAKPLANSHKHFRHFYLQAPVNFARNSEGVSESEFSCCVTPVRPYRSQLSASEWFTWSSGRICQDAVLSLGMPTLFWTPIPRLCIVPLSAQAFPFPRERVSGSMPHWATERWVAVKQAALAKGE